MTQLIQLIYASSAVELFTKQQLVDLLHEARTHNKAAGITGMLLYRDGNFLQVLEGEAKAVDALYQGILKDPRHTNVLTISRREIESRIFHDWEMGFTTIEDEDIRKYPGFTDFLQKPFTPDYLAENPSRAGVFLETFRNDDYMR
ncbi:MAG: BLUF domain-containing protein [Anaerolineaceae bacterium]|nr:MAG: BLUF domain-containing protein [Anaerolineaceae bacterium]